MQRARSAEAGQAVAAAPAARPRLGFLGVGWIGLNRLQAVANSGLAEIAAIADPVAEMLGMAAAVAPGAVQARSLADLLSMELDGVVIATPSALHAEQAVAALERGMAVFCQKPLARTAAEARRVVDAARAADRLLAVDLSYRFTEGMRRIRSLVQRGELGHVYALDLRFHNAYGPDKPWFRDPRLAGGGCLMDLGIHLVDLALWTLDYPAVRAARGRLFARGRPLADAAAAVEDYAVAELELGGGACARIACSWNLPAGRDAVIEAEFYGTRGGAALRNVNGSFYDFVAERYDGTAREALARPPDAWGGRAIVEWTRRLAAGERFDAEAERLVDVAAVLDRLYGRELPGALEAGG
jgi:predicted dehydrogenase